MHVVANAKPSCGPSSAVRLASLLLILIAVPVAKADSLTLAVASNFRVPAEAIAREFAAATGHEVRISSASTGKLYAQIVNGAPFDVLLAADSERPRLLEEAGFAVKGSRITYAIGSLVLWSRDPAYAGADCSALLDKLGDNKVAIANPVTAPYGIAAKQFLVNAGHWPRVNSRLVYGESIAQALHFVASGNASLGLIAASQALDERLPAATCSWIVPPELHEPIEQQAVVVNTASAAANAFLEFLESPAGQAIVIASGYRVDQ